MKRKPSKNRKPNRGKIIKRIGSGVIKVFLLFSFISIVSLFFLSVYYYLLESPYIKLEQLAVEGIEGEIRDEVIRACNLHSGLSLVALNLYELKQKIEKHPWIKSARLERQFPHTLILKAEKEIPYALVLMDRIYCMNREGKIFTEANELKMLDFPVITGCHKDTPESRKQMNSAFHIMNMLASEEPPWTLENLSEIHINENESMSIYFKHIHAEIVLNGDKLASKIAGLRKVAGHLIQTDRIDSVNRINLDAMDGAVVSFKRS
jgi:cell division protein FtsQ